MSTNYINQITDTAGTTHDIMEGVTTRIFRGTCSTAASTTAKVATLEDATGYTLAAGVRVAITFTYGNSATTPTLNVNSGGAKTIATPTAVATRTTGNGTTYNTWGPYETVIFTYDGTYWLKGATSYSIYNAFITASSAGKDSTKLFLIGAESQATLNAKTYSNTNVYIGTDNCLYSNGVKVLTSFTESDPIFVASAAYGISSSDITGWNGKAAGDHVHGNITNGGDITATAPTIASGDQIIINDSSASKITNGPTFDGSTTTKYLSQKGTWESLPQGTAYSAGTGLSLSDTTFNHSNSVTAQTTQAVYPIKIDAQGHISAYGTAVTIVNTRGSAASGGTTLSVVNTGDMYTWNNKQDKATTLSGYGITDAKISNGTITLGSNTITPLTSFTETDPVFSASAAAGITSSDITNWNGKTSNTGTVTSVCVQATSPVQSSTNTEQSTTLNTTISLADAYGDTKNPYGSKTANFVLAAPNGSAGVPTFRALVADDLPVAATNQAGIVSTTAQYYSGRKYFIDGIYCGGYKSEDTSAEYGVIWFRSPSHTTRAAAIQANVLDTTGNRTSTRFSFFQYSYTENSTTTLSYYDVYRLPAVAAGKAANTSYNILNSAQASRVFVQSTAPSSGMAENDIWIDTTGL